MLRIMEIDCGTQLAFGWHDENGVYHTKRIDLPVQIYGSFCVDCMTKAEREIVRGDRHPETCNNHESR
jgi:hypothetical protein